ncbi:cytospin-B isoform X2 [Python bivittatus]|uniref:Cytospin-B isoform X2 n=1 Tax=Python bivittatus TaxID=176946 RepID=A0A9F5J1T6_PYTBI|nr:cytospin-B isoform X2 [Python bivittatus]
MKGAARPWGVVSKPGSHGTERGGKPLPAATGGMRPSKSSTSLAFDSRLSKLKRASSEDMLSKPGGITASGGSRLKKTITTGAISELAENRLRPSTGSTPASKRTGIPAPRELPSAVAREKAVLRPRKAQPSPTSSGAPTPTKHSRPSLKPKNEAEAGEKAGLASQVKELLAEAKAKDSEITKLRNELKKHQDKDLAGLVDQPVDGLPAEVESLIQALQEKNKSFQRELLNLGEENRLLKEKLSQREHSPLSDTISSSSLPTPTTQESSFGSPTQPSLCSNANGGSPCVNGPPLRNSGSSSSDVTKASLSPDASDFEHIVDVPSRPASSSSNVFKTSRCSTSGSSPNNVSDLSVASLTERIQRMEENHHCTAEELQATLQELSDQQQVVQELTAENEKLAEEKAILESSFCQHRDRAEQLSQENEKLTALLQERPKADESKAKAHELELKCAELQEKAQFEREKMLNIQQQLTSSLRSLEREHQEAQGAVKSLGEEAKRLGGLLETERQNNSALARTLEDCKVHLEGLKIESESLRSQLDSEKRKAAAMDAMEHAASGSDVHEMLRGIRAERDQLERACTELRQELLKAHSEVKTLQGQLAKVEKEREQLKETCDGQAEQLSQTGLKLQERNSENEAEMKNLKETIFELEDQVEQHRAVKLHNDQIISDLENNLLKLEDQKLELERQLKMLNKQIKEDTEEWRRFQADLQTAVVVANDIKCEVQQELRTVKRRLLEEEEKTARLQKELEDAQGTSHEFWILFLCRLAPDSINCTEAEAPNHWQGVSVSRLSPTPPESLATVKSLIKSFDLGCSGGTGQTVPIHKVCRSPLSNIPTRTAPAAAVSPIQRHSTFTNPKSGGKAFSKHTDLLELPLGDLLKGRNEELKPDPFLRKSPSLESLSKPPTMTFAGRMFTSTPSGLKPPSKLSVERKDPLAALAREYGGSKRNALLKWCQKKTEGYPVSKEMAVFSSLE